MRAVIEMEGGLIHSITSEEELEILVIDRDTEGLEEEEGMILPSGDRVYIQNIGADIDELTVENLFSISWDGHSGGEVN